ALVFANADPSLGKWGISAFLVDRRREGFRCGPARDKMGLRTAPLGEIHFDDCFVADDERLGAEAAGVALSTGFLEWERCCILASQLGAMQRQLEDCIDHARRREQFGQPIGKFQSVSNRIADMRLRLETSRLLLYRTAWLKMQDRPALLETAMLKLHLSECFTALSMDAIRVHGAHGYMSESG
ncbi:MAG: acyl-CoA dehydrogenase, partial [Pseudomonadales bacterium]|nr:acyl-CoA dehydrogenase [Pseudomonadales bacterium]